MRIVPAMQNFLRVSCFALACALLGCSSGGGGEALVHSAPVFRGSGSELRPRCRVHVVRQVPRSYPAFEARILAWLATCVKSRTHGAYRELLLVSGNESWRALWRTLAPGQSVAIRPRYVWSDSGRVERIDFAPARADPGDHPDGADEPVGDDPVSESPGVRPGPGGDPLPGDTDPEPKPGVHVDPPILDDILDDARKLVDWLHQQGEHDDANELAGLIDQAAPLMVSVGLLVGGYYFAVKYRAGRLLFLWGWSAHGPRFLKATARLERLLPRVERSLDDIARVARRHPQLVGSGIDWKVLDQIVDPTIPAQIDDMACGPACVQMVLRDRGIEVAQEELTRRARSVMPN